MDWTSISAIASFISSVVVAVSVVILVMQLKESQKTKYAETFFAASSRLQDEQLREKRSKVFMLNGKPLQDWSSEDINAAEIVCHNFDIVGIMVRNEMLPKEIVIDNWGQSLRGLWPIVSPLVQKYRHEWNAPEYWNDFQWLAEEATRYADKKNKK
jgi:hypothetical protein